ncbi:nitroreductase family protein [Nocardia cyriacigeorgica]|uniref:Nitroreductase n=1 Tax=Nocardia cyriacigeorgica TaxID=135487 RepID=A0A6P1CYU5_9NOCA|nr:nitroreductase family protein [Nocardia cyriacigeorgica]NEW43295.1 nitroreductase [Nocardia cyriacigeorgica]
MAEDFPHLDLSADEVLTTTRSVRKRLDLERPVPLEVVTDALDVALQAPSGSNMQSWHWLVLTDPEPKKIVAEYYRKSYFAYAEAGAATRAAKPPKDLETAEKWPPAPPTWPKSLALQRLPHAPPFYAGFAPVLWLVVPGAAGLQGALDLSRQAAAAAQIGLTGMILVAIATGILVATVIISTLWNRPVTSLE